MAGGEGRGSQIPRTQGEKAVIQEHVVAKVESVDIVQWAKLWSGIQKQAFKLNVYYFSKHMLVYNNVIDN